jgi:hypothetical protein
MMQLMRNLQGLDQERRPDQAPAPRDLLSE